LVRVVGLEPTNPRKDGGFKDRCVCVPPHPRIKTQKGADGLLPFAFSGGPRIVIYSGMGYSMGWIASKDKERIAKLSYFPFRDIRGIAAMFRKVT
jgi:hypothetical protein